MANPIYPTPFKTASELINNLDFLDTLDNSKVVEVVDIMHKSMIGRLVSGPRPNSMLKLWTIELSQTGGPEISNTFLFKRGDNLSLRVLAASVNDYIQSHLNELPTDVFNIIASYHH